MTVLTAPARAPAAAGNPIAPFTLDPAREAHEPPEAQGRRRDDVRLMVSVGERRPRSTPASTTSPKR